MSQQFTQPIASTPQPGGLKWWQKPVVAIATVVVVTGITGGVAYAATRGDSGGTTTQDQGQFPGGGTFPGGGQGGGQVGGRMGQAPGGSVPGQPGQQGTTQDQGTTQQGQTSRDSTAPTT